MCGIVGYYSFSEPIALAEDKIAKAMNAIASRGPDASGIWQNEKVFLGHTRLSLVDLSEKASQPMLSSDKNNILILNGEIFNFRDLKKDLLSQNIHFNNNSDTEVLLNSLIQEGTECLNKLNGFYSFSWYDIDNHSMILANDRFGNKPLYYHISDKGIIFSSLIEGILPFLSENPEINISALNSFFTLTYIPYPLSIYSNIKKIEPGTYLEIGNSKIREVKWYTPVSSNGKSSSINFIPKFHSLMESSVDLRLKADTPVGILLSGGLDSSIIAWHTGNIAPQTYAFTLSFPDFPYLDESASAAISANKFGLKHHIFSINKQERKQLLYAYFDCMDEPFGDSSGALMYMLATKVKGNCKAVLTGDGADELFGGYRKHNASYLLRKHRMLFKILTSLLPELKTENRETKFSDFLRKFSRLKLAAEKKISGERYWYLASFILESDSFSISKGSGLEYTLLKNKYLNYLTQNDTYSQELLNDLLLVLPGDMLIKGDRSGMAAGVETRNPFLDINIVEYALNLNENQRINKNNLRNCYKGILPDEIIFGRKKGFEAPISEWATDPELWKRYKSLEQHFIKSKSSPILPKSLEPGDLNSSYSLTLFWLQWCMMEWLDKKK